MIVAADRRGPDRRRPELPQQRHRPERHAGPADGALRATSSGCRCGSSPRRGPARSRAASRTTSAASSRSSPIRRRRITPTSRSPSARSIAMFIIDWRLTAALARAPAVLHVPDVPRRQGPPRGRGETQKSLAEMSAATEETLRVSGMLLSKTFGQQAAAIDGSVAQRTPRRRSRSARRWSDAGSS